MNAAIAVLKRMNIRVRHSVQRNAAKTGLIVTLEKLE
jgi:hypothetical protein